MTRQNNINNVKPQLLSKNIIKINDCALHNTLSNLIYRILYTEYSTQNIL
jgi:hypothetical protein